MPEHEHDFRDRLASEVRPGDYVKHPEKGDDWVVDGADTMPSGTTTLWVRPDQGWDGEVDLLTFSPGETVPWCPKDTPS